MSCMEPESLFCQDLDGGEAETITEPVRWAGRSQWFVAQMQRSIWKNDCKSDADLRFCVNKQFEGRKKTISVHIGYPLLSESIDVLNLSVRAYNCLKRCGIATIHDLMQKIEGEEDLLKIRNLGRKSAEEILDKLEAYQNR